MDLLPKKKGRPKKTVVELEPGEPQIVKKESPKKRGRKKKEPAPEDNVVKQKKKRGRKAAIKYFSSSIRKKIPLTAVIQDNNQYILHLDVQTPVEDSKEPETKQNETVQYNTSEQPLCHYSGNNDTILQDVQSESSSEDLNEDLKELYENRLKNRDKQDQLLIQKLEKLALSHEPNEIDPLVQSLMKSKHHTSADDDSSKEQCVDTVYNNRKKGYFELMYDFVHNEEWLQKTHISCWWCCHQFDSVPLGLPLKYIKHINKFRVRGVFCSFPCMLAFNVCSSDPSTKTSNDLVNYLHFKLTGQQLQCRRAPPKWTLKMFGGELDIDEFRQCGQQSAGPPKLYKMIYYPMFMSKDYVEEVDIANIKNVNQNVFITNTYKKEQPNHDKMMADAKARLSKITDTVVTPNNTIDKFINFS